MTTCFKKNTDTARCHSFAQAADYATTDQNIFHAPQHFCRRMMRCCMFTTIEKEQIIEQLKRLLLMLASHFEKESPVCSLIAELG